MKAVGEKLNPDNLVLMQVPPLRNSENNEMAHERINQFNNKLEEYFRNNGKLHATVLPSNYITLTLQDYNSLLNDGIRFSYGNGMPFLRNINLSVLLQTSNSLTTFRKNSFAGARSNNPNNAQILATDIVSSAIITEDLKDDEKGFQDLNIFFFIIPTDNKMESIFISL